MNSSLEILQKYVLCWGCVRPSVSFQKISTVTQFVTGKFEPAAIGW
jgi:hypothetical protein